MNIFPVADADTFCLPGGSHSHHKQARDEERHKGKEGEEEDDEDKQEATNIVQNIINTEATLNEKLEQSRLKLFSSSVAISSQASIHSDLANAK